MSGCNHQVPRGQGMKICISFIMGCYSSGFGMMGSHGLNIIDDLQEYRVSQYNQVSSLGPTYVKLSNN
jgi:hypothetical protein